MAEFKVSPERLKATSLNISKINTKFTQLMDSILSDMRTMKQKWDSEAANNFLSKFERLKDDFEAYSEVIKSYSNFLNATAEAYENSEKEVNKGVGTLFS